MLFQDIKKKLVIGLILFIILCAYMFTSNYGSSSNENDENSTKGENTETTISVGQYENMIYKGGVLPLPFPTDGYRVTSEFQGGRLHPVYGYVRPHKGTDIVSNNPNSEIIAVAPGKVTVSSFNSGGYGYWVEIDHGDLFGDGRNIKTRYGHMRHTPQVSSGQTISAGTVLGIMGATGAATGPHLHFEVLINGSQVNARPYFLG